MGERFIKLPWKIYKMFERSTDCDKLVASVHLAAKRDFITGKIPHSIKGTAFSNGWSTGKARRFLADVIPELEKMTPENEPPHEPLANPLKPAKKRANKATRTQDEPPHEPVLRGLLDIDNNITTTTIPQAGLKIKISIKPPQEGAPFFQRLSYNFRQLREELYGDTHFNPYEGKHLKQCKRIVEVKASGDQHEVMRRLRNLYERSISDPKYWTCQPGQLEAQWERLVVSPDAQTLNRKDATDEFLAKLADQAQTERASNGVTPKN